MAKYIGAIGVAVSDLDASLEFYTSMIGMVELQRMELPTMQQVVLGFEGVRGPSVLLMRHNDASVNTKDNPIKLVFYVPDTAGMLEDHARRQLCYSHGGESRSRFLAERSSVLRKTRTVTWSNSCRSRRRNRRD